MGAKEGTAVLEEEVRCFALEKAYKPGNTRIVLHVIRQTHSRDQMYELITKAILKRQGHRKLRGCEPK